LLNEKDLYFASLVSSRICHDLLAPISGAVMAASMLQESKNDDIVKLATSSIDKASEKLQFFRAAFSFAKGPDSPLIKEAKNAALGGEKHIFEWKEPPFYDLKNEGHWSRLILNLSLVAYEALPKGGSIEIDLREIPQTFSLIATGPLLIVNEEVVEALEKPGKESTLRTLPSSFSRYLIDLMKLKLKIHHTPQEFKLSINAQ
jgi:histidine phosphotransferase ChpT